MKSLIENVCVQNKTHFNSFKLWLSIITSTPNRFPMDFFAVKPTLPLCIWWRFWSTFNICVCVCMIIQNDDANWTCDNHTTLWDIFSIIYFLIFWNTIFKLFTKLLAKRWKLLRLVNDKKCRRNPIVRYIVIFSFFAV